LLSELSNLDTRLSAVERERAQHRIGGPIAMMGVGYGVTLLFGGVGLIRWSIAEEIRRDGYYADDYGNYDLNDDGTVDGKDEDRARRTARVMGGLSLLGAGLGITGTVLLVRQLAKRRQANPELQSLRLRKLELLRHLQYGGGLSQNGLQLTLRGTF